LLLCILVISCGQKEETVVHDYVNDNARLLSDPQIDALTEEIRELENSIGSQIVILTIDSLNGQKVEEYSLNIANEWQIGRKDYDDGILITVAKRDRKIRIEVGYGLERIVRDEIAASIIEDHMAPRFREENYFDGLQAAVRELKNLIKANKNLIGKRMLPLDSMETNDK
jgi:uncharacterized membrane protein YgcG